MPLRSHSRFGLLLLLSGCAGTFLVGCGEKPSTVASGASQHGTTDPWPAVATQLRREADAPTVRRALEGLNHALAQQDDPQFRPAGLTSSQEAEVRTLLNLTDPELQELRPVTFSPLDSHHVLDSLYFRDIARSLETAGLPPEVQADLAFRWVCRQVVLHPWVGQVSAGTTTRYKVMIVPPSYVLRRGSGCGLERAYVFLALLQQLGVDGCLIGPSNAGSQPPSPEFTENPGQPPRGPFWGVGVRVGAHVLVFDPFRGEPVPGPGGKSVATLAQITANPQLLKPWRDDKTHSWDVPVDVVKASIPFLTVSLSEAAPRMARLEQELKNEVGVKLYVDPKSLRDRFEAAATVPAAKVWAAPDDPFTLTRVLRSFLPPSEGGVADPPQLLTTFQTELTPLSVLSIPPEMDPRAADNQLIRDPIINVLDTALLVYRAAFYPDEALDAKSSRGAGSDAGSIAAFLSQESAPERTQQKRPFEYLYRGKSDQPGETTASVREQVQRGRLYEVARDLVQKREEFQRAVERVRSDRTRQQSVRDWLTKAREVFPPLLRAQADANPSAIAAAAQRVTEFRRTSEPTRQALVEMVVADAGVAESTYLLALCRHEQAEREQARYDRLVADPRHATSDAALRAKDKASIAWDEAVGLWQRYEPFAAAQDVSFPGRAAQVRSLSERATRLAALIPAR